LKKIKKRADRLLHQPALWYNPLWSGRDLPAIVVAGDLNAPEAHKLPWEVALPAFGGFRSLETVQVRFWILFTQK